MSLLLTIFVLITEPASASSPLATGVACGKSTTWDGYTYTCTDTAIGGTDFGPSTQTLHVEPIATGRLDLSTVTTALAGKQDSDADLTDLADGSLSGSKVGSGFLSSNLSGGVAPGLVDLSTVTTALNAKQASDLDLDDLADGSLSTSKIGAGALAGGVIIPVVDIDLSTVAAVKNLTGLTTISNPWTSTSSGTMKAVGLALSTASFTGGSSLWSLSKIQLLGLSGLVAGMSFYCNNCSPAKVVVATGTSNGNFADAVGGIFK